MSRAVCEACLHWITAFVCQYTSNISKSKRRMTFSYLGSLHLSEAITDAQIHQRTGSASGVMADSAEEFSWTVTSRWRTACLQRTCSSHSSAKKRQKRKSADRLQKKEDWLPGIPQWWNFCLQETKHMRHRDGNRHQRTGTKEPLFSF